MIQFSRGLSKTETKSNLSSLEIDFHKFFHQKHTMKEKQTRFSVAIKGFLRQEPLETESKQHRPEAGTLWGSEKQETLEEVIL